MIKRNRIDNSILILIVELFLACCAQLQQQGTIVYLILLILFFSSLYIIWKNHGYTSFISIFFLLFFVFHCSYFVFWLVKYDMTPAYSIIINKITEESWLKTAKYCCWFVVLFTCGVNSVKKNPKKQLGYGFTFADFRKIGWVLLILCFFPRIYSDLSMLMAYVQGGYLNTFSSISHGYIETLAQGFYYGLMFLIVGYIEEEYLQKKVLIASVAITMFGMLSGRRQEKVTMLLAIFIIYWRCSKRTKEKKSKNVLKKFGIIFGGYLLLVAIATFGDVRSTGYFSAEIILEMFLENFSYKLIFTQMEEFGYAGFTLAASLEYFPQEEPFWWKSYVIPWVQVIPNIGGIYTEYLEEFYFAKALPSQYQYWLGGSFLGEFFYSFQNLSYPFMFLCGVLIGKISIRIDSISNDTLRIGDECLITLLMSPVCFLWIRGSFSLFPRTVVWYFILCKVIKCLRFRQINR